MKPDDTGRDYSEYRHIVVFNATINPVSFPDDQLRKFRGALKTQLGLELKPTHAPIEILDIDHVERPSEN